jgi:16S rRNA (cytidine1402-2'-O)-methyltransferase
MGGRADNGQQATLIASSDLMDRAGVADQDLPAGSLYVVGMPIGNAADITVRALWVLARVDAIAAEDTRVTGPLLRRFGVETRLIPAHQHNERKVAAEILTRLARGERIALVTDAGTPGVSDPGALIVRSALDAGRRVIPVPGASSAVAAVSAAGLEPGQFQFIGFLPGGARERERALRAAAATGDPFVMFEAPHRIGELAALLSQSLHPKRRVVLARELSKKFETISVHTAEELAGLALEERGEYVVLVDASGESPGIDAAAQRWLLALLDELPPARAAALAARVTGMPKDSLYALALQLKPKN